MKNDDEDTRRLRRKTTLRERLDDLKNRHGLAPPRKLTSGARRSTWAAGAEARIAGVAYLDNPYGSNFAAHWREGWAAADRKLQRQQRPQRIAA